MDSATPSLLYFNDTTRKEIQAQLTESEQRQSLYTKILAKPDYNLNNLNEFHSELRRKEARCRRRDREIQRRNDHIDHLTSENDRLAECEALPSIEALNRELQDEWSRSTENESGESLQSDRRKLPAFKFKKDLVRYIESHQVVVISGETGCGKSTQVPQFILDHYMSEGKGSQCVIACTQPRRISAISLAQRVAEERGEATCSVGYQIRMESSPPREKASILYCTTGIILQMMRSNPFLLGYSHLILDEIHERDIMCDFLLAAVREILPRRPSLRVVLMSATVDAKTFSNYFARCPRVRIPGFTHPVQEFYLEDVLQLTGFASEARSGSRGASRKFKDMINPYLEELRRGEKYSEDVIEYLKGESSEDINRELIFVLLDYICTNMSEGAILVFLPGWEDISKVWKYLESSDRFERACIYPLHSNLRTIKQREVFEVPPSGFRKIILSTNIAETSITIEDVMFVVDCGRAKISNYDPNANITTLQPEWESKANEKQRRGRAGRTRPGYCFKLFTRARESTFLDYLPAEMRRKRLEDIVLMIKFLELGKISTFLGRVLEPPTPQAVINSVETLKSIGAIDDEEVLTPIGYQLANLSLDPQLGRMLLFGVVFSCLDPILSVVACLSYRDPFYMSVRDEELGVARKQLAKNTMSDHFVLINIFKQWMNAADVYQYCQRFGLSEHTLEMVHEMKRQFAKSLYDEGLISWPNERHASLNKNSFNEAVIRGVICAGLYPNVVEVLKGKGSSQFLRADNEVVFHHPKSVNFGEKDYVFNYLVYHKKMRSSRTLLHDSTEVPPVSLVLFGSLFHPGTPRELPTCRYHRVKIDSRIHIDIERETARLLGKIREALDMLVDYRISTPAKYVDYPGSREEAVLNAVKLTLTYDCGD